MSAAKQPIVSAASGEALGHLDQAITQLKLADRGNSNFH